MVEFCLVTHRMGAFIEDSDADLDRKPDYMAINGQVTLTPRMARGDAVLVTDDDGVRTVPVMPIVASIVNGVLTHEGEPGVYVFAGGPNSNPEKIVYTVTYSALTAGKHKIALRSTSFEAIPGGEVDLAGLIPVAGTIGAGITRGEPGESPRIVDGVWWIGNESTGVPATGPPGDPGVIEAGEPITLTESPAGSGLFIFQVA